MNGHSLPFLSRCSLDGEVLDPPPDTHTVTMIESASILSNVLLFLLGSAPGTVFTRFCALIHPTKHFSTCSVLSMCLSPIKVSGSLSAFLNKEGLLNRDVRD